MAVARALARLFSGGFFWVMLGSGCLFRSSPVLGARYTQRASGRLRLPSPRSPQAVLGLRRLHGPSLRQIGVLSKKRLLWTILFGLVFATTVIYLRPLQAVFGTNALVMRELALLSTFLTGLGSAELRRIRHGQRITVDGDRGLVLLEVEEETTGTSAVA